MSKYDEFLADAGAKPNSRGGLADQFIADARGAAVNPGISPIDPSAGTLPFRPFGIDTGLQMPQGVSRFLAGAGKAMVDVGRGAGQMVGLVDRSDIDQVQQRDKALMQTGAGIAGGIAGNVAMSLPAMLAGPAGATIGGQAAIGAAQGALQPVGTNDSRLRNIGVGGAMGAAIPAALRAGKVLKAGLVDPFTDAGRTRIVGGALNRAAADPVEAAANMQMASGATPGFMPTAGQAADDAGIASLERAARSIDPAGFSDVDSTQRGALVQALRGIAQTPEERAAAVAARDAAVKPLYDEAKQAVVPADQTIISLLKRPSMSTASKRAADLAAERGENFAITAGTPERVAQSAILDAQGNPLSQVMPMQQGTLQGSALHDLKMGLDDAIGAPGLGGMQGAERNAALGTKEQFLNWLENAIPAYGKAKSTYADMSKPINQMDVGQELYNRFVPALADNSAIPFRSNANSLAQALRGGDKLAANVTGLKGATLEGIMTPEQMATLRGVVSDSQMKAAAETAGRVAGSNTHQNLAMDNLIAQAGLPSWTGAVNNFVPVGGALKTVGNFIYSKNDDAMRHLLADVLKDPARAAEAMKAAGVTPSQYAQYLRAIGQVANPAVPAAALQQK